MEDNRTNVLVGINSNSYALSGKVMLASIIVVFSFVIIIVCFHSYARRSRRRHLHRQRQRHLIFNSDTTTTDATTNPSKGLDLSVFKSLPTFNYSCNTHNPPLECAVCLSEFEKNDKGRLLPKCNHCFHIQCIDMWFQSHSSCPLCRAPVQPSGTEKPAETVVLINEQASTGVTVRNFGLHQSCRISSSTSSPAMTSSLLEEEERERKPPLELVGLTIEAPTMIERLKVLEEMGSGCSRDHGHNKSPGGGVLSLKRIWSV